MHNNSIKKRDLAAAQRGLIIQRVLVDGWSPAEAGKPFGVDERQVAWWIAAYQRHGMASLRGEAAVECASHQRLATWFWGLAIWLRGLGAPAQAPARRGRDRAGTPNDPDRRSLWN